MIGLPKGRRKDIGERIERWEPLVLENLPDGWRATKLTRTGHFSAKAITVRAAQMAVAARRQDFFAL